MTTRTPSKHITAFCGFPNEVKGRDGHEYCRTHDTGKTPCTCPCHGFTFTIAEPATPPPLPQPYDQYTTTPAPEPEEVPTTHGEKLPPTASRAERRADAQTWAGFKEARFPRSTGTMVVLIGDSMMDGDEENPYATLCDDHDQFVVHRTMPIARQFMSAPEEWCETCMANTHTHKGDQQ